MAVEGSSIPIPEPIVEDACRAVRNLYGDAGDDNLLAYRPDVAKALESAAPKLYAHWAEQLVARIRSEGAKDASNHFDGPLLEAMFEENGGGYFEDCDPQRLTDGAAKFVSSLLGLGDRSS